uniref:Ovule protein n=1 Tax=Ascaris lumbricoides TaxID=6252 RepID=A0A0M3IAL8_ASCLU
MGKCNGLLDTWDAKSEVHLEEATHGIATMLLSFSSWLLFKWPFFPTLIFHPYSFGLESFLTFHSSFSLFISVYVHHFHYCVLELLSYTCQ